MNPFENRDLTARLVWPTLSWSSFNNFDSYDRDEWYVRYVKGIRSDPNPAMMAGIRIGERLVVDPAYLPEVPRPEIYELELFAELSGIKLTGHIDGWSPTKRELLEYKTTANLKRWTSKTVDKHGQLDFYCLLLWLNYKIRPEEITIRLVSIPVETKENGMVDRSSEPVKIIPTKRTMTQVLLFAGRLQKVYGEMRQYVDKKVATKKPASIMNSSSVH